MNMRVIKGLLIKYMFVCSRNAFRAMDVFFWPLMDLFVWGFLSIYMLKVSHAVPSAITFLNRRHHSLECLVSSTTRGKHHVSGGRLVAKSAKHLRRTNQNKRLRRCGVLYGTGAIHSRNGSPGHNCCSFLFV